MNDLHASPAQSKISPAMAAHLERLSPRQKTRAIVLLRIAEPSPHASGRRHTPREREATIDEARNSTSKAVQGIDDILVQFDGRRLSTSPSALGTIAVESTPAGIRALSRSDDVRAILEDQPISRVS